MEKYIEDIAKRYYVIHQEFANSLIIHSNNEQEVIDDQDLVNSFLNDLTKRLEIKLNANGKVSSILKKQLLRHHSQIGEEYVIKNDNKELITVREFFQSREILDLIELVEQKKCKTERKPFRNFPLKGLGHVHHGAYATIGFSAIKNCINYWFYNGKLKENKENELKVLLAESEHNLAVRMYNKAVLTHKTEGLTGEWLIYKKLGDINYYLCLAKHAEGDENIRKNKILPCLNDFPELESVLHEEIKIVEKE